jgi:nicotinamide-nucleotide amidase
MEDTVAHIQSLARDVGDLLGARGMLVATAESCTAGGVAYALTQIAGSSAWFDRGMIVYSNDAKQRMLGVPPTYLRDYGAVSEPVARAMALGALQHSAAQVAVSVTGIAGPGGGTPDKPVGTVCFCWALHRSAATVPWAQTATRHFAGDRAAVRTQSIIEVLDGLKRLLGKDPEPGEPPR